MAPRIRKSHKTTEEIMSIISETNIDTKLASIKAKFKKIYLPKLNFVGSNIFIISNGEVRCVRKTSPAAKSNPNPAASHANQAPPHSISTTIHDQQSSAASKPIPVQTPSTGRLCRSPSTKHNESNLSLNRTSRKRIRPALITARHSLRKEIKTEMQRMQKEFIIYATHQMNSTKIHPYILENWK